MELAGRRYPLGCVALHPEYRADWEAEGEDEGADTVDLALVELATPVEEISPLPSMKGATSSAQTY